MTLRNVTDTNATQSNWLKTKENNTKYSPTKYKSIHGIVLDVPSNHPRDGYTDHINATHFNLTLYFTADKEIALAFKKKLDALKVTHQYSKYDDVMISPTQIYFQLYFENISLINLKEDILNCSAIKLVKLVHEMEPFEQTMLNELIDQIYEYYAAWLFNLHRLINCKSLLSIFDYCGPSDLRKIISYSLLSEEYYETQFSKIEERYKDYFQPSLKVNKAAICKRLLDSYYDFRLAQMTPKVINPSVTLEVELHQRELTEKKMQALLFCFILGEKWMKLADQTNSDEVLKKAFVNVNESTIFNIASSYEYHDYDGKLEPLFVLGLYYESLLQYDVAIKLYQQITDLYDQIKNVNLNKSDLCGRIFILASIRLNELLSSYLMQNPDITPDEKHQIHQQILINNLIINDNKEWAILEFKVWKFPVMQSEEAVIKMREDKAHTQKNVDRSLDEASKESGFYPSIKDAQPNIATIVSCTDKMYQQKKKIEEQADEIEQLKAEIKRLKEKEAAQIIINMVRMKRMNVNVSVSNQDNEKKGNEIQNAKQDVENTDSPSRKENSSHL